MDKKMPKEYEQPNTQRKRTTKKVSGVRKKAKAHMKQMEMSLTIDNKELIAMTIED
jgi:hypothetical protein